MRGPGRFATLRAVGRTTEGRIGIVIVTLFVFIVMFGPALAPYGPNEIGVGPAERAALEPRTGSAPTSSAGTSSAGCSCGSRSVILIPVFATLLAFLVGGLAGMTAGFRGGRVDAVISTDGRRADLAALPARRARRRDGARALDAAS